MSITMKYLRKQWNRPKKLRCIRLFMQLWLADAVVTLTFTQLGGAGEEANPLMRYLLEIHPALFAAAKLALGVPWVLMWEEIPLWLHRLVNVMMFLIVTVGVGSVLLQLFH